MQKDSPTPPGAPNLEVGGGARGPDVPALGSGGCAGRMEVGVWCELGRSGQPRAPERGQFLENLVQGEA